MRRSLQCIYEVHVLLNRQWVCLKDESGPEVRFHCLTVVTALPMSVQDLGYPGEIGYQTFLYSSVKEWRRLLMFLLEKLPKEKAQTGNESLGRQPLSGVW